MAASKAIEATGSENHAEKLSSVVRCRSLRAFLVGAEAFLLIMDLTAASPSAARRPGLHRSAVAGPLPPDGGMPCTRPAGGSRRAA